MSGFAPQERHGDERQRARDILYHHDHYEIERQVRHLERSVLEETCALRLTRSELRSMQKRVDDFIEDYCAELGSLFAEIERLEGAVSKGTVAELDMIAEQEVTADSTVQRMTREDKERTVEAEIKHLYKKLVKKWHPDTNPSEPDAAEAFALLRDSYIRKDLSTLVSMERALQEDDEENLVQKLERLEREHAQLRNEHDALKWQHYRLIHSNGYKLCQLMRWQQQSGQDMLGDIRRKAEVKLTALRG